MPCQHALSPTARRKLLAINVAILALKLTELAVMIQDRRRHRPTTAAARAAAQAAAGRRLVEALGGTLETEKKS